jgi:hypothetical protein
VASGTHTPIALVLALSLIAPAWVHADDVAQMQSSIPRTCQDLRALDAALTDPQSAYLAGWHHNDYTRAKELSNACSGPAWSYAKANRAMLLAAHVNTAARMEIARQDALRQRKSVEHAQWSQAAEAARQTEVNRKHDIAQAAYNEKNAAVATCKETKRAELYDSAQSIIGDLDLKRSAQEAIARERKVGAVSGIVDKCGSA